jgi:septum site-determining protein MinD
VDAESDAGQAYTDAVSRFLGEAVPFRFLEEKKHWFKRLFSLRESEAV